MNKAYPVYFSATGFIFIILGVLIGWYILPSLQLYLISNNIALIEDNDIFALWEVAPYPLKFKVYLFNVTNPDEVQNGFLPQVTEVGPYIYDEFRPKIILNQSEENDTVEYTQRRMYSFNQEESGNYSDDDILTVINFGLLGVLMEYEEVSVLLMDGFNQAVPFMYPGIKNPFITAKVKEILFDGFPMKCEGKKIKLTCTVIKSKKPPANRRMDEKRNLFTSIFYHLNNSDDGPYIMRRGSKNSRRGEIISYKNRRNFEIWGKGCNTMRGTDLTVLPQISDPSKGIDFFAAELCRSIHLEYTEEFDYEGVKIFKFSKRKPFGSKSAEKSCYCTSMNCPPFGTFDGGACYQTPIIISMPHFYLGAQTLRNYADGLEPDGDKHATEVSVEPRTATPISVKFRAQVNIRLRRIAHITLLENVSEGIFPILWFEESNDIPDDIKVPLMEGLLKLDQLEIVKWVFIFFGMGVMLVSCLISILHFKPKKVKIKRQTEKGREVEKLVKEPKKAVDDFCDDKIQIIRI